MGLFLAMSSVVGAKPAEVAECVAAYAAARNGVFELAAHEPPEREAAFMLASDGGVTLLYPADFTAWDDVSAYLSHALRKPVFSWHIHDGDLWMFVLFVDGAEAIQFNPIPDYWEELTPLARAAWLPSAADVARHVPGVRAERIAPYLVEWPPEGLPGKAQPEDEFAYVDWQVVDFLRELGFRYPGVDAGVTYRMRVKRRR
ncbi:MAG: hypothetical protein QM811_25600 [Pirellulales bacterium]